MLSWDYSRDEGYDCAQRYQAELDAAERARLRDGWQPLEGWRREPLPMCPKHNFGLVRGLCGRCIQDLEAKDVAA